MIMINIFIKWLNWATLVAIVVIVVVYVVIIINVIVSVIVVIVIVIVIESMIVAIYLAIIISSCLIVLKLKSLLTWIWKKIIKGIVWLLWSLFLSNARLIWQLILFVQITNSIIHSPVIIIFIL